MRKNVWQFRGEEGASVPPEIVEAAGGSLLVARLLYQRGVTTPEGVREFLELENYVPTSGWELPDMKPGIERMLRAIDSGEHILIFGDFDVDGITGTSVLVQTFKHLGANVSYYIPDRATEGHGLNVTALCRLVSTRNVKLVITTDTGITNFNEVSLLNGLKVDTIVTDHHELPENLPPSLANINPKLLPDQNHPLALMAGVGVAYKVCELLLEAKGIDASFAESLLDLVAVGTVADLASLHRENRYLVWRGVQILNRRQRLGINEILEQAGTRPEAVLSSETCGFTIGPRLNALGRLDNATEAVELLTTTDKERARIIAAHLEHLNRRRQDLCEKTFLEAEQHLMSTGAQIGSAPGDRKAIILASPGWNPGIIGIVASRLIEKYHVPVFMMVVDESKGEVRCSARSINGFHMFEELSALEHYFIHYGGHGGAAGFALKLEKLEALKRDLYDITSKKITEDQMRPVVEVDAKLDWSQLNTHLVEMINKLAPFGKDNPSPLFVLENVTVAAQRVLGSEGRHLKLILTAGKDADKPVEGLVWNFGSKEKLNALHKHSFVVAPELNTFNNVTKVQLIIHDYKEPEAARKATELAAVSAAKTAPPKQDVIAPLPFYSGNSGGGSAPGQNVAASDGSPLSAVNWIDHRSRESVESFVSQLMLPLQDGRKILLYHEGRKPQIPFLDESILCERANLRAAEDLIFWDIPPDIASLKTVLDQVNPSVVHWVGGKYHSVPVFPAPKDYLKVVFQTVNRMAAQKAQGQAPLVLELESFAMSLATTRGVVTNGLMLLSKLELISVSVPEDGGEDAVHVHIPQRGDGASSQDIGRQIEFIAFQQALREVSRFRDWLLSAPLDQIKSSVMLNGYYGLQKEDTRHEHLPLRSGAGK